MSIVYLMGYRDSWFDNESYKAYGNGTSDEFITAYNKCMEQSHFDAEVILAKLRAEVRREPDKDIPLMLWWTFYSTSCEPLLEYRRTIHKDSPANEQERKKKVPDADEDSISNAFERGTRLREEMEDD